MTNYESEWQQFLIGCALMRHVPDTEESGGRTPAFPRGHSGGVRHRGASSGQARLVATSDAQRSDCCGADQSSDSTPMARDQNRNVGALLLIAAGFVEAALLVAAIVVM
jgi:hypothetical protein